MPPQGALCRKLSSMWYENGGADHTYPNAPSSGSEIDLQKLA